MTLSDRAAALAAMNHGALVLLALAKERELEEANRKLMALAEAYDNAPGLPLEAPGVSAEVLTEWTNVLCGFGYVLHKELTLSREALNHEQND